MKKKTLQKFSRLFASLVLVGAMSLGTVATANAKTVNAGATTYGEGETATAAISVEYKMGNGVTAPANNVKETFTKKSNPKNTTVNMPDLTAAAIDFEAGATTIKDTTITDYTVLRRETTDFLGAFVTYMNNHPTMDVGEYVYTLTSTSTGTATAPSKFVSSQAQYGVHIFVAQKSTGGLYIKGTGIVKEKNDDGTSASGKVDGTPGTHTGGKEENFSKVKFVNEYVAVSGSTTPDPEDPSTYAFKVSNTAVDSTNSADSTFNYEMTLTAPALSGVGNNYTYYKVTAAGKGTPLTATYGTKVEFALKNGEYVIVAQAPQGTKATVKQIGKANWTPVVEYTFNNKTPENGQAAMGKDLSVENKLIGTTPNKVDYTNTYKDIAVTGIIVNNFPFVMMIVMAMAAFVAIVAVKSRRRMNER